MDHERRILVEVDLGSGHNPTDWQIAGLGDFNRDGTDDIKWLNNKPVKLTNGTCRVDYGEAQLMLVPRILISHLPMSEILITTAGQSPLAERGFWRAFSAILLAGFWSSKR